MLQIRIDVQCYAGARGDECPRRIVIDGREHLVSRLIGESVEEPADTRERTHRYEVLTDAGIVFEILHKDDAWFIES